MMSAQRNTGTQPLSTAKGINRAVLFFKHLLVKGCDVLALFGQTAYPPCNLSEAVT